MKRDKRRYLRHSRKATEFLAKNNLLRWDRHLMLKWHYWHGIYKVTPLWGVPTPAKRNSKR